MEHIQPLHTPVILEDLQKSGIKPDLAKEFGWYELSSIGNPQKQLKDILGFVTYNSHNLIKDSQTILIFPYFDSEGKVIFSRAKVYGLEDIRYLQPSKEKAESALYILPNEWQKLKSPKTKIVITEGEKKKAKLTQELKKTDEQYVVIGIAGITLWQKSKGWYEIPLKGKDVFLAFDTDSEDNSDVRREEIKLYCWLKDKGAQVKSLSWSQKDGKGIDDYLVEKPTGLKTLIQKPINPFSKYSHRAYFEIVSAVKSVELTAITRDAITEEIKQYVEDAKQARATSVRADVFPKEPKKSQCDSLIEVGLQAVDTFFTDQKNIAYARFYIDDHFEIAPLRSKAFKNWLSCLFYKRYRKGVNSDALRSTLNTLEGKAFFEGPKYELFNRIAQYEDAIFYDLTDEKWQAIKITKYGWNIVSESPILFRRYTHQKPQVMPSRDGNARLIEQFWNLKNEDSRILALIWLISCFLPHIPHPIPILYGSQGSAKSTFFKLCKMVVDPSINLLLSISNDKTELVQNLDHNWFAIFDNIDKLFGWQNDALSRAVTGEGFSKRQLYTDEEDVIFSYKRCIGLNGINCVAVKPDLLDRAILFELKRVPQAKRKEEKELWAEFDAVLPQILSGCFDALSKAMSIFHSVTLEKLERMADFTKWGFGIAEALGIGGHRFLQAYSNNTRRQHEEVIEANPVALALKRFMSTQDEWQGTASELLAKLEKIANSLKISTNDKSWPKQPHALTRRLNTLKVNLAEIGIEYQSGTHSKIGNLISLKDKEKNFKSFTASPTQESCGFPSEGIGEGINSKALPKASPENTDNNVHGEGSEGISPTLGEKKKNHKRDIEWI